MPLCPRFHKAFVGWKLWYIFAVPLLLLPLPIYMGNKAGLSAYAMIWMAAYWTLEPIPLAVTALMPLVLFPMFGVLSSAKTTTLYFNNIGFVLFGSLAVAAAVETSRLHQRLALKSLLGIGTSNRRILLGFMLVTMFMSMWIPNTASASIMTPIVVATLNQIHGNRRSPSEDTLFDPDTEPAEHREVSSEDAAALQPPNDARAGKMRRAMLLAVAYAANIGGTGSLIGTPPNLILQAEYAKLFGQDDVTFLSWMAYNVPPMLLCTMLAWLYVQWKVAKLTFHQAAVLTLMTFMIFLWLTQNPRVVPGWSNLFPYGKQILSSVPAVLVSILLFVVPKDPHQGLRSKGLLTWEEASVKIHWGTIFIICGGMTLAEASKDVSAKLQSCKAVPTLLSAVPTLLSNEVMRLRAVVPCAMLETAIAFIPGLILFIVFQDSGLSAMLVLKMRGLNVMPSYLVVGVLCFFASMLTEVTSNTAITAIMLPIIFEMAVALEVHPLYFAIPVVVACSFSFMLPAATPPNAIVYEMGNFRIVDMAAPGFVMNMVCVVVELVAIHTLGPLVFGLHSLPEWAATDKNATVARPLTERAV
ncbi:solute carrier family 13 member 2-like [Dermacentor andersoni]|uniref:solute carrier family 13 member 2-like n=1 Tax=Dermacentor andersoni TaxID=34620 RepID=UPI003B3AEF2F